MFLENSTNSFAHHRIVHLINFLSNEKYYIYDCSNVSYQLVCTCKKNRLVKYCCITSKKEKFYSMKYTKSLFV